MALPLLLAFALSATPPVPSDCQVDRTQDIGRDLTFVDTRCAGEKVVYLCSEQKCMKDPCGGYEGDPPSLVSVGSAARAGATRTKRSRKTSKGSHRHAAAPAAASSAEVAALFIRGPEQALQVVTLSVNNGTPTCHLVRGLDEVLVAATNAQVKIGETLGRSGERDALHGQTLVLTRGLYAGGDEPGAPSHGYLRIRAKLTGGKLKFSGASRISQDTARFGRH